MTDDDKFCLLRRSAEALYGTHWHTDLARALDVNPRTVQRWSAGVYLPPRGVWLRLAALLGERRAELAALVKEIGT